MKCDYDALKGYLNRLNSIFANMNQSFANIESSNQAILNHSNWNSITRDFYYKECDKLWDNFDLISTKFLNIRDYIDQVINNYQSADANMKNAFTSFGGKNG